MEYLVIGVGAIGTYIGASLLNAGKKVSFVEREEYAAHLKQGGLHLRKPDEDIQIREIKVYSSYEQALKEKKDVVVFAMKSFDTITAAEQLKPMAEQFRTVLCLQNGVENEGWIENAVGKGKVTAGSVLSAVSREDAGSVRLERERGIGIEDRGEISRKIHQDFLEADLLPKLYPRRADMKWSKMISNLLGNATCAILDMTPSEVYSDPDLFHIEVIQIKETLAVMRQHGWKAVNLPKTPIGLLCSGISILPESISRPILWKPLGGGRGNKMPSFHIDLHSGRGQSEVQFLNGAVSKFGRLCGVDTPVNDVLNHTLLKLVDQPSLIPDYRKNKGALIQEIIHHGG